MMIEQKPFLENQEILMAINLSIYYLNNLHRMSLLSENSGEILFQKSLKIMMRFQKFPQNLKKVISILELFTELF